MLELKAKLDRNIRRIFDCFQKVTVVLSDGRRIQGTVIHQTQPLITSRGDPRPPPSRYSMWDLAVVVTHSPLCPALPLPLATSLPPQGDPYSTKLYLIMYLESYSTVVKCFIN